jgi:cytochrome o ubiquinol oxidase subunit 3
MIAAHGQKKALTLTWLGITFAFGATFIGMEIYEFHHLIVNGNGPGESAFLSAFFALVGLHGAHVSAGLIWMTIMIIEIVRRGLGTQTVTRLSCLSLFWHFLDIVWICVFTVVYLMGAM